MNPEPGMDLSVPATNNICIAGQVVSPPHFGERNNTPWTEFVIANNRTYRTRSGELKKRSCFIAVITWGNLATACAQYLDVESPVYIEGILETPLNHKTGKCSKARIKARDVEFLDKGETAQESNEWQRRNNNAKLGQGEDKEDQEK